MTQQILSIIYIPGLGDHRIGGQQRAVNVWKLWGVEPHLFQMDWHDAEPWESKLNRLLALIDNLTAAGKRVGLVGASAGAAAVITAYAVRREKILGCVLISGKVNRPEAIGEHHRKDNQAFVVCAYECQKAIAVLTKQDRERVLSRYAFIDRVVSKSDSNIPGAHNEVAPSVGHAATIALQITLGAPSLLLFVKHCA